MSDHAPVISVVIVSYNTRELTLRCLRELHADLEQSRLAAEVWLVDNASADDTVPCVRAAFPQTRIIANERNLGFAAANNQAMAESAGEFFLLINSDAFVRPGAVAAMLACLKAHPRAGLVGPRLLNSDGSLQLSCFRFPSPIRCWLENLWIYAAIRHHPVLSNYQYWAHDSERAVDFVIGACLFVRRGVWDELGGFDPRFFMYSEEIDWQRRMQQAGWQVIFTPAAEVVHLGGASGATQRAQIKRHFFDSLDYYQWKHHGLAGLISMRMAMVAGCAMRAALWTMLLVTSRARRELARSKAHLHCWLVWRQMTHWRLSFAPTA